MENQASKITPAKGKEWLGRPSCLPDDLRHAAVLGQLPERDGMCLKKDSTVPSRLSDLQIYRYAWYRHGSYGFLILLDRPGIMIRTLRKKRWKVTWHGSFPYPQGTCSLGSISRHPVLPGAAGIYFVHSRRRSFDGRLTPYRSVCS